MLKGRLGLETARVPYVDRYGLIFLSRGRLYVEDGVLRFATPGSDDLKAGDYCIPYQSISCILFGPGGTVTHDALRILARHGTGMVVVGEGGVRFFASMPFGTNESILARRQVECWADKEGLRNDVVRRMYALRLGEIFPKQDINVLRGIEGARMKETYKILALKYGVQWEGRRYNRASPDLNDEPNAAINHAATAIEAAAMVAVAATSTIPQLGFIHEDASISFVLDIADLFRDTVVVPVAFEAVKKFQMQKASNITLEQVVRKTAGHVIRKEKIIPKMIERIKGVLNVK